MDEIGWFSPPGIGDGVGYGYAAIKTIESLNNKKIKVSYDSPNTKAHISFVQPEFYHGNLDQYRIGYTPWESSKIPELWPSKMNEMDEIWTTSNYCVDIFKSYNYDIYI